MTSSDYCESLGHAWRHVTATRTGDMIWALLTCDRCPRKVIHEMSAINGELISEIVVPPEEIP